MLQSESVPPVTKYPDRPPATEPLWLHLDWIQANAGELAESWEASAKLHAAGFRPNEEPDHRDEMEQWQRLWGKVMPLWSHALQHLPPSAWESCAHIASPFDAERSPSLAVQEWRRLRNYAHGELEKAGTGADSEPAGPAILTPAEQRAYNSHERATEALQGQRTLKDIYRWIKSNGVDDYDAGEPLPDFAAWKKAKGRADKKINGQVNQPRTGRKGAPVNRNQI